MSIPAHEVGTMLPELPIALDRTTIVAAAISSQDFEDVHHDPGKANERGTPDIFLSINSTHGFVDRYDTDWTGPAARLVSVSLRLGVPAFPGDTLLMTGEVVEVEGDRTTIEVVGGNERGAHVTARVVVEPTRGSAR